MMVASDSCASDGDLGDVLGCCCGPTMFGRCGGLAMRSTHGSAILSVRAREISCRVRPGVATSRRLLPGWNVIGYAQGAMTSSKSDFGGPVGPPAPAMMSSCVPP
jgi:hypothetical protein